MVERDKFHNIRNRFKLLNKYKDYTGGNTVDLLNNGDEAFPAMIQAINQATREILLESYIFRMDSVGNLFINTLLKKGNEGVKIQLHFDALGCWPQREALNRLFNKPNISLKFFHPVTAYWGSWKYFTKRNHRKILVIDNEIAFLGGINIGDEYLPVAQGGSGYRDIQIRLTGPAVEEIRKKFINLWQGHDFYDIENNLLRKLKHNLSIKKKTSLKKSKIKIVGNTYLFKRYTIRNAYRRLVREAKASIRIINPYFIPDKWLLLSLLRASRKGIRVEIILPKKSNQPVVGWAMRYLYSRMLRNGIRLYEWHKGFIHIKSAVADDHTSIIGSFNLDRLSLVKNLEIVAVIKDRIFGGKINLLFEEDLNFCTEVNYLEWQKRKWYYRLIEQFAYIFRWWL